MSSGPLRGRFITLEGIEGVGKSTNLDFIAAHLRASGVEVVVTREPGGVPLAERIRELLLAPGSHAPTAMAELLLMFAARSCHLEQLVWPALEAGQWVVCDRFTDASYAYQGAGRGCGDEAVHMLEKLVQRSFRPDLTLLLDADWEVSRTRRAQRGHTDRFEQETRQFFDRVRAAYLQRAAQDPERMVVVPAAGTLDEVRVAIVGQLDRLIRCYLNNAV